MKLRTLFLGALIAGLAHAGAAPADFKPIEVKLDEKETGTIEVYGIHLDAYRGVATDKLHYSIWAHGDTPASQGDTLPRLQLQMVEDEKWVTKFEAPLYEDWNKYGISFPYQDAPAGYSDTRLAPIHRCNERLMQTTGEARKDFMYKGATITVAKAYVFRGFVPSVDGGGGKVDWMYAPLTIKCLPLDHVPVRASFRIEPAKVEKVGKFLCPMELKLHGFVESRTKFQGKAIFFGPHYLSAITDLDYATAGSRNINATYKIKWNQMGGLTTAPNTEAKKQDLLFHFNITNQNGTLVRTPEERVQVSCRKIKSNAPTVGDGMAVNPAN
jgi:hypothetical protein